MQDVLASEQLGALGALGFVRMAGPFARPADAWSAARALIDAAATTEIPIAVIGEFVIPPPDGPPSRDFQMLHLDFGLPLAPVVPTDVARFTALHVHAQAPASDAVTRLVPLRALLVAGAWPDCDELIRRFAAYGDSHGMWEGVAGYVEGSLARIVEAALGQTPVLPSVTTKPGFLCGTEFATLADERLRECGRRRPSRLPVVPCGRPRRRGGDNRSQAEGAARRSVRLADPATVQSRNVVVRRRGRLGWAGALPADQAAGSAFARAGGAQ